MGDHLHFAASRLSAIQFVNSGATLQESHHALIREYFRRINDCLNHLGFDVDLYPIVWLSKALGIAPDDKLFHHCPQIQEIDNPYLKAVCYGYLDICKLADEGVSEAIHYLDLYEPMIQFIERGGIFTIRQGEMVVGRSCYPLKYWRDLDIPAYDTTSSQRRI
ncbi:hypothetical protein [Gorillibacterium sp. CAU 1737]|uniref:hypothetical protein n=1 Tax=Gorillibacterium sp. CAU 1737 TaxID=3140362 RepID=UPI003260B2FB